MDIIFVARRVCTVPDEQPYNHTDIKLDFKTRTQPTSARQPQPQIRICRGALDTVTNTRIYESQRKVSGIAGKLMPYSQ
ncbi:hypothetical protein PISMIDRAFT_689996 [Pisolithus microcarpus 441]|uniref:Uncharacterized protein n=1 Tax=Pisolithus microcarpus 441 TaxID=765257 RepID=A0A0C9XHL1_9AGAM|nr:hypothetical protein PISMIDRAFT_689996 [Pisolithus microcarpus 441]